MKFALIVPPCCFLPDEPYVFGTDDVRDLESELGVPACVIDGKDLFWYGARTANAIDRIQRAVRAASGLTQ